METNAYAIKLALCGYITNRLDAIRVPFSGCVYIVRLPLSVQTNWFFKKFNISFNLANVIKVYIMRMGNLIFYLFMHIVYRGQAVRSYNIVVCWETHIPFLYSG